MTDEKRKQNRERYAWYKAHGICVKCGRHDAFNGRVECEYCIERRYLYSKTEKCLAAARNSASNRYHKRLETGMCPYCGKNPIQDGHKSCSACRRKLRRYRKARCKNFTFEKESWMCRMGQCLEPAVNGGTLCVKHNQQMKVMLVRSISARKQNGHIWIQPIMGRGKSAGQGV